MTKEKCKEVLQALWRYKDCGYSENEIRESLDMAIKALEPEPKTGHWIMTNDYLTTAYGSVDYVKCSCCGEDSLEEGNYCPNCGAEMREVEE
jgi:hypothetical protein